MSLVSQNARRCSAEITADYRDGRGEIQATNASGCPTSMLVVDAPQCPQAPISSQCVNTSQAIQDPNDLEVLIDEQSRRLGALKVHDPLEDRSIALVNFVRMKSQKEGSIQQSEMLEFLREYSDQFPEILRRASAHLDQVFGLKLRVIDPQADTYNLVSKRGSQITDRIFLWGSRAHREITKMEALKFVSDAHDEEPWSWPEEYNKALEADKTKERSLTAGLEFWSEDTMNDKANDLVQLAISVTEEMLPIHQDELLAHTGKEFEDVFPNILNRATLILDMFYGLSLIEVDTSQHIYLLVQQPESEEEQVMLESLGRPTQEYVMPILGLIFLMGNRVKEANVWNLLRRFSGDVGRKHAVTCKLMRQRYLECRPLSYSNPVEYELLWGPRAHHETTKMKVLEYMARLYRKRPQDWPEQYREAVEDEEARAKSEATTMFFLGPT
uniref:MAGE family member E2 n=1 Tax=Nomascus leucogenys TaxID=61853 RepID=A0A2I3HQF5_NOMLE